MTVPIRPWVKFALVMLSASMIGPCTFTPVASARARTRARRNTRRLFETNQAQLQPVGSLGLSLQAGPVQGQSAVRLVLPDLEIELGLFHWLALSVSSSLALEGPSDNAIRYDHLYRDNTWTAVKLSFYEHASDATRMGLAFMGGPKLPTAIGVHGVGVEGVLLGSACLRTFCGALNAGALFDPVRDDGSGRPRGVEGGIDAAWQFGDAKQLSIFGSLGAVLFQSNDPHQVVVSVGSSWDVDESLSLSILGLAGLTSGSDRFGLMLGVSPTFSLWK